ncbi:glycosyltransferase family 2 protein [Paraglaciecola aquimarina]|uniref:Glycosyltransferase family 2 protein n=1 Tax=Paraglaciecola algarum TaxID=3050085 RepID=A0ABS9D5A5_9ALTE|nr:glycosyltransferase family 2 protein [Paraglaciecola sp. G1-23]
MDTSAAIQFSVIIPVYNRIAPLKRALESVLNQRVNDYEIIIIDDGSEPNTQHQISKLINDLPESNRPLLLRHQSNCNGATARNTGIKAARGEYIAFLDSDDQWHEDKLTEVSLAISLHSKPNLIYHQYTNVTLGKRAKAIPEYGKKNGTSVAEYMFVENHKVGIQTSTITVKREIALTCLFNETLNGHQDWDFILRIGKLTDDFHFIPKSLCNRHLASGDNVSGGLSFSFSRRFLKEYVDYFPYTAKLCFISRVLLRKSLNENKFSNLLVNIDFWFAVLYDCKVAWNTIKTHRIAGKRVSKRLIHLAKVLHNKNINKVIIYGANNYAKEIIGFLKNTTVVGVIDSNSAKENSKIEGVSVTLPEERLREIEGGDEERIWIILATDKYMKEMTKTVVQNNASLTNRIVCF